MNIIPAIGLKAARKAVRESSDSNAFYSPSTKRAYKKRATKPDDAIHVSDIKTVVDHYETVLFYGSPSQAKQYLEDNILSLDEETKIKEAVAYFRDVEGLDI